MWWDVVALILALILALSSFLFVRDKSVAELQGRWAPAPSQFITILDMNVHIRDQGPRDDSEPIFLIHGTSASLHTWEGWIAELSSSRRCVSVDLPGFGLTGPDPRSDYSIQNYTRFVKGVFDFLEIERGVVGGNSLGGQIAWNFALAYPALVSKLILVDSAGFPLSATSIPLGFRLAGNKILSPLVKYMLPRFVVAASVQNVYGDEARVTEDLVDRYYELTLRAGNRAAVVERFKLINDASPTEKLGTLELPTLIIWGEMDRLIPPDTGIQFRDAIFGSRLVVFPGLGHVPHEEDPHATVSIAKHFLGDVSIK